MRVCGGGRSLVGEGRIARVGHGVCQIGLDLSRKRDTEREREKVDAIGTIAAMMILRSSDSGRAVFAVEPEWIDC